jgi:hypothetical protein
MPLPLPPNVTISVYRGFNPQGPMPPDGMTPVLDQAPAYLKQHMKNGRFGKTGALLHWVYKLFIDVSDIRDAYNAEMTVGPTEVVAQGDTVVIHDCLAPGQACPCWVVFVDIKANKQTGGQYLIAYLDRALPGPLPQPSTTNPPAVSVPCCPNLLPQNLYARVNNSQNAACLDGVLVTLAWDGIGQHWQGSTPVPGCLAGATLTLILQCNSPPLPGNCTSFNLTGSCRAGTGSGLIGNAFPSACSCSPFTITFTGMTIQGGPGSCCPSGGKINVTVTP